VTTFMDMILNGEMCRKANHKMTGIKRYFKFRRFDQSFCGFSAEPTLAFVIPRIYCIRIILDYNVRSVKNQRVIHRSTQCFIDG